MPFQALQLSIYKHLPKSLQLQIRRTLFPTYLVAAKVLVTNAEGKFLAIKPTYTNGWDIPSGHCDRGESPTDAAAREVLEETGLVVADLQQQSVIFQPKPGTIQVLFTATACEPQQLIVDNVEVSDARWVSRTEVDFNPYAEEALNILLTHKATYWVSAIEN